MPRAASSHRLAAAVRNSNCFGIILCIAAVLRVASIFILHTYRTPKTWEFGEIAHVIVAGHGYTVLMDGVRVPSAYMPPFYPYLLSFLWNSLGESGRTFLLLELVQALFGVLLVFYIYRLAALLFSSRIAFCAAALTAIWPTFIYLCNEFHSISIYIVLGVASAYYLVRYIEVTHSWKDATCLGLFMGALFYCRAETGYLLLLYILVIVWRCGKSSLHHAALVSVIALACIAPWTIRNYRAFGRFVLVTTSAGDNLWIGHNPHAIGNSTWDLLWPTSDQREALKALEGKRDSEVLIDQQARAYAIEFARSHVQREVKLAARKMFFFLVFDPTHPKGRKFAYWGPSFVLLLLALYGAWLHRSVLITRDLPVTITVAFAFLLSVAVFALPRYRIAIDPFLMLFAANAITSWIPDSRRRVVQATARC